MVLGTGSHVGKSLLTAGLCRVLAQEGVRVAPFKAQNMSLNSAATVEGLEIGRAQAMQAEACGVPASVHMNPVLLKPSGNMTSQVVVRGKIWGQLSAADYHQRRVKELLPLIAESYETLAAAYDVIVLEGAGSPAEINLKQNDIVNMRMAALADAACVLVGDIDCGGVFASLFGTVALLEPDEAERIRGFVVNKFRGDVALLEPGIAMIEDRLGKPCVGVVPWLAGLAVDEEDSVSLESLAGNPSEWADRSHPWRRLRVAVIALPSFSNFTDFDALRSEPCVSLVFTRERHVLAQADVVVLPGSKETAADLLWMRDHGLAAEVSRFAERGLVTGICGGLQMLGETIADPEGIESGGGCAGLGLLPLRTVMQPRKTTQLASGTTVGGTLFGQPCPPVPVAGYEIHVGSSLAQVGASAFADLRVAGATQSFADGCVSADSRVFGTYLHGVFDADEFRHAWIAAARSFHELTPADTLERWGEKRRESFDRLADAVRSAMDLPRIFGWLGLPYRGSSEEARGPQ